MFERLFENKKNTFFKQYSHCADKETLERIWQNKQSQAEYLSLGGLSGEEISNLSPLKGLVNLEKLSIRNTNVSDLSPLKGLINLQNLNDSQHRIPHLVFIYPLLNIPFHENISCF